MKYEDCKKEMSVFADLRKSAIPTSFKVDGKSVTIKRRISKGYVMIQFSGDKNHTTTINVELLREKK